MPEQCPAAVPPVTAASQPERDTKEAELVAMLICRKVPDKAEIIRVKGLVRDIARERFVPRTAEDRVRSFISAYFDLYLGLVTADAAIEKAALRRCLSCLSFDAEHTQVAGQS